MKQVFGGDGGVHRVAVVPSFHRHPCFCRPPMSTYQELLAQQTALAKQAADLDKRLQEARRAEQSGVIAEIKRLMVEHGLSIEDLGGNASAPKGKRTNAGQVVAPKYRDPATGKTWTGRGLKPKWVAEILATGKSLDDLRI